MTSPNWAGVFTPALFLCLLLGLNACTTLTILQSRGDRAQALAQRYHWRATTYQTPQFKLVAYHSPQFSQPILYQPPYSALNVYLEGDGAAFSAGRQTNDPTPGAPTTLNLAALDPNPHTLYLARPCQYLSPRELSDCPSAYWSSHRYADEVVASLSNAIDQAKLESGAKQVKIFGYSGGGALAVLIAARRNDVTAMVTISANLDHKAWTQRENLTPLYGSLNAADFAAKTAHIPQIHFFGEQDDVVPPYVTQSYEARIQDRSKIRVIGLRNADHNCCWIAAWPALLRDHVYQRIGGRTLTDR